MLAVSLLGPGLPQRLRLPDSASASTLRLSATTETPPNNLKISGQNGRLVPPIEARQLYIDDLDTNLFIPYMLDVCENLDDMDDDRDLDLISDDPGYTETPKVNHTLKICGDGLRMVAYQGVHCSEFGEVGLVLNSCHETTCYNVTGDYHSYEIDWCYQRDDQQANSSHPCNDGEDACVGDAAANDRRDDAR